MTTLEEPVDMPASAAAQQHMIEERTAELRRGQRVNAPPAMEQHEKAKLRAAAVRVKRLGLGAIGELVSREIMAWEEFGYRLDNSRLMLRVIDRVMNTPLPAPELPKPPTEPVIVHRIEVE